MPFTLIKGTFEPSFGRPDGDSLRFVPDDPSPIFRLRRRGRAPKVNPTNGSIQLRYEAIDTMESSALEPFASDATASNLNLAGTNGGAQNARGHIFSSQLGPNGRPIAFVFAGDSPLDDGADVFLDADAIMESINVKQLALGHAYPLFYDTLFDDLRERCAEVSNEAKTSGLGVWSADRTNTGVTWTGDADTLAPIFPKLWRRIDKFVKDETYFDEDRPFANLLEWIDRGGERISIPSQGLFTGFDNVLSATDTEVRMTVEPHKIVVIS